VRTGLPGPLWTIVLLGALLTTALSWFFDMRSHSMHLWMTVMLSAFLGLLIYLLGGECAPKKPDLALSVAD
jgi:hypothetical protein